MDVTLPIIGCRGGELWCVTVMEYLYTSTVLTLITVITMSGLPKHPSKVIILY